MNSCNITLKYLISHTYAILKFSFGLKMKLGKDPEPQREQQIN